MNSAAERTRSYWMTSEPPTALPPLGADARCDVCIVGAGIAGLSVAYTLAREGRSVIVLDSGVIGGGMTGRTTAHLSNAVDDRYYDLMELRGEADARLAAASHGAAIDRVEAIQAEEGIECDFARLDGFLMLAQEDDPANLERELEAAHRAGLADVEMVARAPLQSYVSGPCLRFPRQGRFHPLRYLLGLVRCIRRDGGSVYGGTHVVQVHGGREATVETAEGRGVRAGAVVVATNTPVNDRVAIHTKQAPYRTYVIAARVPAGSVADALYWDTADPYHYVRLQPEGDGALLIVGGEDHKTGQAHDWFERFDRLEAWARPRFPAMEAVTHRWSGQVMEPVDDLGFIGRNPADADNVYIATGDSGMGITHGVIAGMIIPDLILGRSNPWAELYDPTRMTLRAGVDFAKENLNAVARFRDYVTPGEIGSAEELKRGEGAVVRRGLRKVAAYRDENGVLMERSAICTHVGCIVTWNALEGCWDCPCHGSQFAPDGTVLQGPAISPLGVIE